MADGPMHQSVRGRRPRFHADPAIDRLIKMVLTLTSELSVTRDRLDSLQALAEHHGWLKDGALEGHVPLLAEREVREKRREELLGRVFHVMHEELAELEGDGDDDAYWTRVKEIEEGAA